MSDTNPILKAIRRSQEAIVRGERQSVELDSEQFAEEAPADSPLIMAIISALEQGSLNAEGAARILEREGKAVRSKIAIWQEKGTAYTLTMTLLHKTTPDCDELAFARKSVDFIPNIITGIISRFEEVTPTQLAMLDVARACNTALKSLGLEANAESKPEPPAEAGLDGSALSHQQNQELPMIDSRMANQLARHIFEFIKPSNPHGPQDDLYFGMPYCSHQNAQATKIATSILENFNLVSDSPALRAQIAESRELIEQSKKDPNNRACNPLCPSGPHDHELSHELSKLQQITDSLENLLSKSYS